MKIIITEKDNLTAFGEAATGVRDAMRQFVQKGLRKQKIYLTYEMYQVVQVLIEHEKLSQVQIASLLNKDKASITYLLDNLSKRKVIVRETDPIDRRRNIVTLTKEGYRLEKKLVAIVKVLHQKAGQGLSDNFLQQITEGLMNIKKNITNK